MHPDFSVAKLEKKCANYTSKYSIYGLSSSDYTPLNYRIGEQWNGNNAVVVLATHKVWSHQAPGETGKKT
jgi:hypothetical protein